MRNKSLLGCIFMKKDKHNLLKKEYNIVGRASWLSQAQIELFSQKVKAAFPDVTLNVLIQETKGDKIQSTPLHKIEGKDFFTKDIQDILRSGEADFAIHSMKDVSGDAFFEQSHYVVFDRDDLRDVAIFNPTIIEKLQRGEKIIIGTSSPRRASMATVFLQKALPFFSDKKTEIEAISIRGNVNVRLEKLEKENYDGIILAAAGLNRLLNFEVSKKAIQAHLADKKIMLLPLFECPPAAGQGAIVAETNEGNFDAIKILQTIESQQFTKAIQAERAVAEKHGFGCSQAFGTFHLDLKNTNFTYASGKNKEGEDFVEYSPILTFPMSAVRHQAQGMRREGIPTEQLNLLNTADYMKDFFSYHFPNVVEVLSLDDVQENAFFIASHKIFPNAGRVQNPASVSRKDINRIWAAGTRTWYELAKQGVWVEGCADGLGLENLISTLESPLIGLKKDQITILTNTESAKNWQSEGRKAIGMYELIPKYSEDLIAQFQNAEAIFWTSFQQYVFYKKYLKAKVLHVCPAGKTADLLQKEGIEPVIFPTIRAFKTAMSELKTTKK
jgi:hydroxymethylbilane synthase